MSTSPFDALSAGNVLSPIEIVVSSNVESAGRTAPYALPPLSKPSAQ
ncbi:MAG: hypothetical protein II863_09160 [Kiritimatiellae bacterium]|nr:hypothetical protein [Kiritimatiellia bacterium]